jgi:DNA-binding LytR/AlgR family response regulator
MKVVVIEDEEAAAQRLKKMLSELDRDIEISATLDSIERSIAWFTSNTHPSLIFADIQLADGPSFEIFKKIKITAPVVFITAFDSHALEAFRFNGIDYLLKPIKKADVERSLKKYKTLGANSEQSQVNYHEILSAISNRNPVYQKRIVVRIGQTIRTIEIAEVAYFFTEEKIPFACMHDGKRVPLDLTLDELEKMLDPTEFFRINRQFIIHIRSIESMFSYSKSRIKIILKPRIETETIVSSERSPDFKQWLLGKG